MPDTKFSNLTAATTAADANEFAINEAGTSKKLTGVLLKSYVTASPLKPTAALYETFPRSGSTTGPVVATLTTGKMILQAIHLPVDTTVTNIVFVSSNVAAVSPTNWWFALYDSARALLRQTADQTTTAWGASTIKTVALTSPFVTTYSGLHYIGESMVASTVNNLIGLSASQTLGGLAPVLFGATSDTGLTTTAPATAGAITTTGFQVYAYVS